MLSPNHVSLRLITKILADPEFSITDHRRCPIDAGGDDDLNDAEVRRRCISGMV